jgi:hypothetical protein
VIRRVVNRAIRSSLDVLKVDAFKRKPSHHYVPNYYGRSARKQIDIRELPRFGALAKETIDGGSSYLYYDRLFTLYTALENVARRASGPTHMAEVGVFRGGTSVFLARASQALGLECALHCVDTFEGHAPEDLGAFDTEHKAGHFAETSYERVKALLAPFPFVHVYKGRIQDESAKLAAHSFSFVHLDVDIYEPTRFGLEFFGARLTPGGVIVVDDYGFTSCPGAKQAVDEYAAGHPNFFVLPLLTGQIVLVNT